jgi:hypothetical protein
MARIDWHEIVARAALAREPADFGRVWRVGINFVSFGVGFLFGFTVGWWMP